MRTVAIACLPIGIAFLLAIVCGCSACDVPSCRTAQEAKDTSRPVPVRVPSEYVQYAHLLDRVQHLATASNNLASAAQMVDAISPALQAQCASPLLADDQQGSLPKVHMLGCYLASNLLVFMSKSSDFDCSLTDVFRWLVSGLRREPNVSALYSAIAIENALINVIELAETEKREVALSLRVLAGDDYLPTTLAFVRQDILTLAEEHLYGAEEGMDAVLKRSEKQLATCVGSSGINRQCAKETILRLSVMLSSRSWSAKGEMAEKYLSVLLADVELHNRKQTLRLSPQQP